MNRLTFFALLGCIPFLARCGAASGSPPPSPQARIRALSDAFIAAWNAHDAPAFAQTFAADADFTNVYGVHVHGRPAIEAFHAKVFATVFKASHQSADSLEIVALQGGTSTVRVHWSMSGATLPGWPAIQHGIITWELAAQPDGSYLIAVMTNALA